MRLTAIGGNERKKIQNRNENKYRKCKRILRVTRGAFRKSPACSKRAHQFSQLHLIAQRWKPPEMEHNSSSNNNGNNKGNKNVANKTKPTSKSLNLQFCSTLLAGCRHSSSLMMAQIVLLSARQLFIFCDAPPSLPFSLIPDDTRENTINFVYCSQNRCNSQQPKEGKLTRSEKINKNKSWKTLPKKYYQEKFQVKERR